MAERVDGVNDLAAIEQFTIDACGAAIVAALLESPVWEIPPHPDGMSAESAAAIVNVARLVGPRLAELTPAHLREVMARLTPGMVANLGEQP